MKKLLNLLKYNNAVPIAISLVLLGAGSAFAAGNPDAILASNQTVVTVDNTYIANKDLATYTPKVEIIAVTEDDGSYYVSYAFTTIDIQNYVWKDFTRQERMVISKKELQGDLGIYVTKRLHDVIENERNYLAQVQQKERKTVTQQTIATTYSGLIGKFLDSTTETLPGYVPVIEPPAPASAQTAAVANSTGGSVSVPAMMQNAGGPSAVALQILGNNPARIALRSSYIDLGVLFLDPFGTNVGVHTFLDGFETSSPNIDTGTTSIHVIEYRATDQAGGTAFVRRIVLVGDAVDPGGEINSSGTPVALAPQAPTPIAAPETPAPAPAPTSTPATDVPAGTVPTNNTGIPLQ